MGLLKKLFEKPQRAVELATLGDAHFANEEEIRDAGLLGDHGIRLGQFYGQRVFAPFGKDFAVKDGLYGYRQKHLRYRGDAHLITVAPTRSGKGRDILIPVLLEYEGSCIVIDPKGQLAAVTGPQRERMGQRVLVLNPFDLLPKELGTSARYNPMDLIDPTSKTFGADCTKLAEAIVTPGKDSDSHWTDSARGLVAGVIGHLAAAGRKDEKNLAMVRDIIAGPDDVLIAFAKEAVKAGNPFISQKLARFANEKAQNWGELGSIISNARTQTDFIGIETIAENLKQSDFRFGDLKNEATTVYLVLPGEYLDTCGKWFRLIAASAVHELWRGTRGAFPVLAILDEFAQVGRLSVIENAMAMAAGYGLQLWPILQDLTQLKKHYGESWETFLSGAEIQQFFAPRDQTTADYISKRSGVKTVVTYGESSGSSSSSMGAGGSHSGASLGQAQQPLLHAHKVTGLSPHQSIIFGPRNVVIRGFRKPFFEIEELKNLACYDPYHNSGTRSHGVRLVRPIWPSPPLNTGYEPYVPSDWTITETPGNPWPVMQHTPTEWAFRIVFNKTRKKQGKLDPYLDCTAIDDDEIKAFAGRALRFPRMGGEGSKEPELDALGRTAIVAFCDRLGIRVEWQDIEAVKRRGSRPLDDRLKHQGDIRTALNYRSSEWTVRRIWRSTNGALESVDLRHTPTQWAFTILMPDLAAKKIYFGHGVSAWIAEAGKPLDEAGIEQLQNSSVLAFHEYTGTPADQLTVDYGFVLMGSYAKGMLFVNGGSSGGKYYLGHAPCLAPEWEPLQENLMRHKPTGLTFDIRFNNKLNPHSYSASISGPPGLAKQRGVELGHAAMTAFLERQGVHRDEIWRSLVRDLGTSIDQVSFLSATDTKEPGSSMPFDQSEWTLCSAYAWPKMEHTPTGFGAMIVFNHEKRDRMEPLDSSGDYAAVYWSRSKEDEVRARAALLIFQQAKNPTEGWPRLD